MADNGPDSIIFLDRNRMFVYDNNGILKLDIPETALRDLDVVDKIAFDGLIDTFIKSKKLDPGAVWLVLADAICFSKDFTETDPSKLETEIKDFLETVPFDQVVSKRYKVQNGIRMIATNYALLESIGEIFERDGFSLEGIVPSVIFPGYNTRKVLDADFAKYIIASKALIKQSNMLQKVETPHTASLPETPEPKEKSRFLPYLLIGFGVLLVVLVAVILLRR